jgi:hypothetical protein
MWLLGTSPAQFLESPFALSEIKKKINPQNGRNGTLLEDQESNFPRRRMYFNSMDDGLHNSA